MIGSDYYGIHNVLLRHAGLPGYGVFPFSVQHGWQHAATRFEADGNPLEIWAWSERSRRNMAEFYPIERIRVIGSPYLYLGGLARPRPSRQALYVLPHSSHLARVGFSHDDLRRLLLQIADTDGSCDVLAYYLDVTERLCATLSASSARVLINGGLWSNDFMYALRRNLHLYDRIYYSSFGSAVLFARHEQRQTTYVSLESRVVSSTNQYVDGIVKAGGYDPTGIGVDTADELGVAHRVAPQQMKEWIIRGFRDISNKRLAASAVINIRDRIRDHRLNVRPSLTLAAQHNAALDRQHA